MELTPIDFDIVEYISKFDEISLDDILIKFPDDKFAARHRLDILSKNKYILNKLKYKPGIGIPFKSNIFSITDFGKTTLAEYKRLSLEQREQKQLELERHDREKETLKIAKRSLLVAVIAFLISLGAIVIAGVTLYCEFFRQPPVS